MEIFLSDLYPDEPGPSGAIGATGPTGPIGATGPIPENLVFTTGDQTVSGLKTFANNTDFQQDISVSGFYNFDITNTGEPLDGQMIWNADYGTAQIGMDNGNVINPIGFKSFYRVKAAETIRKGKIVMALGGVGNSEYILAREAQNIANSGQLIMGVSAEEILANNYGDVVAFGSVRGVNTSDYPQDSILYYDTSSTGEFTNIPPQPPNAKVLVALNTTSANNGIVFVRVTAGSELGGTDNNVKFSALQDNDFIKYNSASGYWENKQLTTGDVSGISNYYLNSNLSGYITSKDVVYTTGDQTVSGIKYFSNDTVFKNNILYISEPSGQISGSGYTGYYDGGQFLGKLKLTQNNTKINNIGNNWVFAASGYEFIYTANIAISSDGKYQSISDDATNKIIVSDDYGKSWKYRGSGIQYSEIAMSSDGKYQIAGTIYKKLYSSDNYGNTWNIINNTPIRLWRSVAISSNGQYQSACADQATDFIYVSNDYGKTWTTKATQSQWNSISMSSDGKYQTAIRIGSSVHISNNYGNTWVQSLGGFNYLRAVAVSSNGQFQTVAAIEGLLISNNYGKNWQLVEPMQFWTSISMSSDGKIQAAIGNNNQIYTSDNYGHNWNLKNSTLACQNIGMSADAKYLTAINNSTIFTSISDEIIDGNFTASNIYGNNLVYNTGDQTISGYKTFNDGLESKYVEISPYNQNESPYLGFRNKTGGYAFLYTDNTSDQQYSLKIPNKDGTLLTDSDSVSTSGTQIISGLKYISGEYPPVTGYSADDIRNSISGWGLLVDDGHRLQYYKILTGTSIYSKLGPYTITDLDNRVTSTETALFNTTTTTANNISDLFNRTNSLLYPELLTFNENFNIINDPNYGNDRVERFIIANSPNTITGTIASGNTTGFNIDICQAGLGQVIITGSGEGVTINSYNGFKTAGVSAVISLIHTGNDGYIMYGNTAV